MHPINHVRRFSQLTSGVYVLSSDWQFVCKTKTEKNKTRFWFIIARKQIWKNLKKNKMYYL